MNFFTQEAEAIDFTGNPYVTNTEMKTLEGAPIVTGSTMEMNKTYKLKYEWKIPDGKYEKGDIINFSIPKELTIVNNFSFEINDNKEVVAIAKIVGSAASFYYISMEFTTDYVTKHSNIKGEFNLEFNLNSRYIKKGDNELQFPPDKVVVVDVPNIDNGNSGGTYAGAGDPNMSLKKGETVDRVLKNPETGEFDMPTRIIDWTISLGKNKLLGKASSFDEINSIFIEDKPIDQELVPIAYFTSYLPDAYGFESAYYNQSDWKYLFVPQSIMNMQKSAIGNYYESFKMDILPSVKKYNKIAEDSEDVFRVYNLSYYSKPLDFVPNDREFKNKVTITINYKNNSSETWELDKTINWTTASGSIKGSTAEVEMKKIDAITNTGLSGAIFDLYHLSRSGEYIKYQENIISDSNGSVKVDKLTTGKYYFLEKTAPIDYQLSTEKKYFEILTEDLGTDKILNIGTMENSKNKTLTTDISVIKKWDDKKNQDGLRPESIKVNLLADGVKYLEKELTASNNYSYTWKDLDKTKDGKEVKYTVEEKEVTPKYTVNTVEGPNGVFTITNTYTPEKTDRTVMKKWDDGDNQDGKRASNINVQLYANGQASGVKVKLNEENNWTYTWENLDKMKGGKKIVYSVKELNVPSAYEVNISLNTETNTFVIVNKYIPKKIKINGSKKWDDNNNAEGKRPSAITVNLLANGKKIDARKVTSKDKWKYSFDKLPKYQNGSIIQYTITENKVKDYTPNIIKYDITNKYTPGEDGGLVIPAESKNPNPLSSIALVENTPAQLNTKRQKEILPQTGQGFVMFYSISGLLLLLIGIWLFRRKENLN